MNPSDTVETQATPLRSSKSLAQFGEETALFRIIRATPFFYELSNEEFAGVAKEMQIHKLDSEKVIIREGESGGSLYFVVSGNLRVVVKRAKSEKKFLLGKLTSGDFFGEHSLLTGSFRTATVVTITSSELLEIPRGVYNEFAMKYESVKRFLVDLCESYQQKTANSLKSLELTRRRSTRFELKGSVKFKEYNASQPTEKNEIKSGRVSDVSTGGISFNVSNAQIEKEPEQMIGEQLLVELKLDDLDIPVKFLGEVISCEKGLQDRKLADFYVFRMKFVGVDKKGKPFLLSFLGRQEDFLSA